MTGPRGTPLDLRAVEARYHVHYGHAWPGTLKTAEESFQHAVDTVADVQALLAYCRALRAALTKIDAIPQVMYANGGAFFRVKEYAAVLAQGRDE